MWLKKLSFILSICLLINACTKNENSYKKIKLPQSVNAANLNIEIGYFYMQHKNFTEAKQKFLLALQQASKHPAAWSAMGFFLESTGESSLAEKYYLQGIKYGRNDGAAKNNYGAYLCRSGNYQQAIKQFLFAAETTHYLNSAMAYKNAANCALKIPNNQLAKFYFDKAKRQDPNLLTPD